jgi:hypothetical protein
MTNSESNFSSGNGGIEATSLIHTNVKWSLLNRLDTFTRENNYASRSKCMQDLIDFALKFMDKVKKTPDPVWKKQLEELDGQKERGDMLKYFQKLNNREFNLMLEIIQQEAMDRSNLLAAKMKEAQKRRGIDV